MGISGLLPLLKPIHRSVHIKEYSESTMAVDTYSWLHKGAFHCASDLVLGRPTRKYVDFCMQKVRLLRSNGVEPYLVFDGCPLPMKAGIDQGRDKRREELKQKGKKFLEEGLSKKAEECFQQCVDVTPHMALELIKDLRKAEVKYVVAPYEADAEMAYLEKAGLVQGVITEDSDLLVFGCKRVITKLDKFGEAVEVCIDRLSNMDLMRNWTFAQFRLMCILSGCDYLPNIPGVGLKTALKFVKEFKTADRVLRYFKIDKAKDFPPKYEDDFKRAEQTFLYQTIVDPRDWKLKPLHPLPENFPEDRDFLGKILDDDFAKKLVHGEICPLTGEAIFDFESHEKEEAERKGAASSQTSINVHIQAIAASNKNFVMSHPIPAAKPKPQIKLKPLKHELPKGQLSITSFFNRKMIDSSVSSFQRSVKRPASQTDDVGHKESKRVFSKYFAAAPKHSVPTFDSPPPITQNTDVDGSIVKSYIKRSVSFDKKTNKENVRGEVIEIE